MLSSAYGLVRPALFLLDPETAHNAAIHALKIKGGLGANRKVADDPILASRLWDLTFSNPIGMAAGFDKDAEVIDGLLALGFGFVEAGTVTPLPQPGNPRPRIFRLVADQAIINRCGFNNNGLAAFVERLQERKRRGASFGIVGANVGKNRNAANALDDYAKGVEAVAGLADYLVCNVSSPNTPGLRSLQAKAQIEELIHRVLEARRRALPDAQRLPPLLAKVGPDLTEAELRDIAEVALATRIDGLIISNTTIDRPANLSSSRRGETGGLSGAPLKEKAAACLAAMYRYTQGKIPLIGCGGIATGADAYARIRAGASLVQLYSALIFGGPGLVQRMKRELAACLRKDGLKSVAEAVGLDCRAK